MTVVSDTTCPPDQTDDANRMIRGGLAAIRAQQASGLPRETLPSGCKRASMSSLIDADPDDW